MKQVTLQFPSIVELIDYEITVQAEFCTSSKTYLTLTGIFSESDIELAKLDFGAIVLDEELRFG